MSTGIASDTHKTTEGNGIVSKFTATHCGSTYTGTEGAERLKEHMREAHGKRIGVYSRGGESYNTYGARTLAQGKAHPWRAPRPTAGGIANVLADHAAGKYDIPPPARWMPPTLAHLEYTDLDAATDAA